MKDFPSCFGENGVQVGDSLSSSASKCPECGYERKYEIFFIVPNIGYMSLSFHIIRKIKLLTKFYRRNFIYR